MSDLIDIACTVNGETRQFRTYSMARMLDVLRADPALRGTKEGCGEGECGACAVLLDGELVTSCLVPAAHMQGATVRTIEGIARGDVLSAVQQAFLAHGGAQCGICTPGMVLAATALLEANPAPSRAEICAGLAGNLCRCTGYTKIVDAVAAACGSEGQ